MSRDASLITKEEHEEGPSRSRTELANAPDWTCFHLLVEGQPFCLSQGKVLLHDRTLDLRDGILRRRGQWRSPKGETVEIQTMRFASMADPHLCVQLYAVTALDFNGEVKLQTWLDGKAENPGIPPFPEVGLLHWEELSQGSSDAQTIYLGTRTRSSKIELGMATGFVLEGIPDGKIHTQEGACPGLDLTCHLHKGQTVVAIKLTAIYTSLEEGAPSRRLSGDARSLCARSGDEEMIEVKSHPSLALFVSLNPHIGVLPEPGPRLPMFSDDGGVPFLSGLF